MYKILEFGGHRTEASRGANIVGMSVWPPDVCLSPYLAKKEKQEQWKLIRGLCVK